MTVEFEKGTYVVSRHTASFPLDSGYLSLQESHNVLYVLYVGTSRKDKGWLFVREQRTEREGWVEAAICSSITLNLVPGEVVISKNVVRPQIGSGYLSLSEIGLELKVLYVGTAADEFGWLFVCLCREPGKEGWISGADVCKQPCPLSVRANIMQDFQDRSSILVTRQPEICLLDDAQHFDPGEVVISKSEVRPPFGSGYLDLSGVGIQLKIMYVGKAEDELGWVFASVCGEPEREGWISTADICKLSCPRQAFQVRKSSLAMQPQELRLIGHTAQNWKYELMDTERRSFVGHLPRSVSGLSDGMLRKYMNEINLEMDDYWRSPNGPLGAASRQTVWVVAGSCRCQFRYGGDVVQPSPWPKCMDALMAEVMPLCGLGGVEHRHAWPNSCNINRYGSTDGIGWHKDDEPMFKGTEQDTCIISLSLGGTRTFCVRSEEGSEQLVKIELQHGDLCTMEGLLQKYYEHRVPAGNKSAKGRINLTWRWIVAHNCKSH